MMISTQRATANTGRWKKCLFSLLLVFCSVAPGFAADDPRDEVKELYRLRVKAAQDRQARYLGSEAFFRRFRRIVEALDLPPERQPTNLFDLMKALGGHGELTAEFLRILESPMQRSSERRDAMIASLTARLNRRLEHLDERLGPLPEPRPVESYLDSQIRVLDPRSYEVSARYDYLPPDVNVLGPVELNPISFQMMEAEDYANGGAYDIYCTDDPTCLWPLQYDLLPPKIYIYWRSTLSLSELNKIIKGDGYGMALMVNAETLISGPQIPYPQPGMNGQGYWSMTMPGNDGYNYIVTVVFANQVLHLPAMPWKVTLHVFTRETLDPPVLIDFDQNGDPIYAYEKFGPFSKSSVTFSPNQTNSTTYFEAMLYPTFQSDRCTDCHGFGTFAKLGEHHGYNDPNDFIFATSAFLQESAYDPPNHVINCNSCHVLQQTDGYGHHFSEILWKAPYFDLDINWREKNAIQICTRVHENLPTEELRHEHFHKDARLFWAIEDPYIGTKFLDPKAEPGDFQEFLRRVDLWNDAGAPCPY